MLSLEDSNLYKQNQNLLCCHYTKGQSFENRREGSDKKGSKQEKSRFFFDFPFFPPLFIFPSASQSSVLNPQSNPFQTRWGEGLLRMIPRRGDIARQSKQICSSAIAALSLPQFHALETIIPRAWNVRSKRVEFIFSPAKM